MAVSSPRPGIAHLTMLAAISIAASCGIIGSEYVPTETVFRSRLDVFIAHPAGDVKPLYGNIDVDSMIGTYAVDASAGDATLSEIAVRATHDRWQLARSEHGLREFHRVTRGRSPSFEVVRLQMRADGRVVVGWLQVDGSQTTDEAARSVEGRWAANELWPRFRDASR